MKKLAGYMKNKNDQYPHGELVLPVSDNYTKTYIIIIMPSSV